VLECSNHGIVMKLAPTLLSALAGLVVVSPVLAVPAEPHRRSGAIEKLECDVAILGGLRRRATW
jgi:hypothetical protein